MGEFWKIWLVAMRRTILSALLFHIYGSSINVILLRKVKWQGGWWKCLEHRNASLQYYQLTHAFTPYSRVLLEKLTGFQLVEKFPEFYGTRSFITALTSARHLSLSWASSIQSIPPHPTSWRSILILPSHLRVVSFSEVSPPNPCIRLSSHP